jgi:hypothetical protein
MTKHSPLAPYYDADAARPGDDDNGRPIRRILTEKEGFAATTTAMPR